MSNEELDLINYELERRRTMEPLRLFKPNGAQARFIEAIADPEARIILFPAGNWIGKTAAAIVALGALIWPEQAEHKCFQNPTFKSWPFPKMARIVSTPKELEIIGSVQTEIKKWWPVGQYKGDKMGKTYPCQFTANGWLIDLLTYDMALDQFEGVTRSITIYNEPPPEAIFNAGLSRMKYGGKVLMPMTPLTNSAWIYDRLVAHAG
jgi:phage terminase large subunit-like protein